MSKKHFYEAPESELLLVKFEGNFMATDPNGTETTNPPYNPFDPTNNG